MDPTHPCGVGPPERVGPRLPHPPVEIDGDDPRRSPTVPAASAAGQPVYRPGSGIVAGDGSAGDPYLVAGWRLPGVTIEDTPDHFVVADNRFTRGPEAAYEEALYRLDGWGETEVRNASNVAFVDNVGRQRFTVADSPGVCLGGNELTPSEPGWGRVHVCDSPGVRVVGNDGLHGLTLTRSPHATVADNAFAHDGVGFEGDACFPLAPTPEPVATGPAIYDHTIPPSNSVDGDPVRYVKGTSGVTVTPPAGQVIVHNATDVRVGNVSLGRATVTYSEEVRIANSSVTQAPGSEAVEDNFLRVRNASDVMVRDSLVDNVPLLVVATSDVALVNDTIRYATWAMLDGVIGVRVVGSHFDDAELQILSRGKVQVLRNDFTTELLAISGAEEIEIESNQFDFEVGAEGIQLAGVGRARVEGNVLRDVWSEGVAVESGSDVVIVDNRMRAPEEDPPDDDRQPGAFIETAKVTDLRVEGNEMANGGIAVSLLSGGPTEVEVHGNNWGDDVDVGIRTDGPPVNGTENWWGCPGGPSQEACADVEGNVTVDPWLGEPNPDAGPDS